MNHPVWDLPGLGSGWIIGIISIIHVSIAHLVVGVGAWLAVMESRSREGGPDMALWIQGRAKALLWLSGIFGAGTGVGIWLSIGLVNPTATQHLIRAFVMAWAIEWALFAGEMATLVGLAYFYHRLKPNQRAVLAWSYALCAWLSLVVINGIITFMLTPGTWPTTHRMWDGFWNATYLPSLLLRTGIALVLGGLWGLAVSAKIPSTLRDRALRPASLFVLAGLVVAAFSAWFYFHELSSATQVALVDALKLAMGDFRGFLIGLGMVLGLAVVAFWGVMSLALGALGWSVGIRKLAVVLGLMGLLFAALIYAFGGEAWRALQHFGAWLKGAGIPGLTHGFRWALMGLGAFLVPAGVALGTLLWPRFLTRFMATVALLLACWGFGGFEWIREVARKPYVIREVMYANGIRKDQVEAYQKGGFLAQNVWARTFAASKGDTDLAKGEALFRAQCLACHTRDGYRSLKRSTAKFAQEDAIAFVQLLRELDPEMNPYLDKMPPFAGTDEEAALAGKYLASLNGK
ncbi:MAG: cytochrome c [Firmicutes bacterium]|nr:cytochrome c [Bacillota bacterium]